MLIPWQQLILVTSPFLCVPLVVLLGQRRKHGVVLWAGGGALTLLFILVAFLGGISPIGSSPINLILAVVALLLILTGWALTLAVAANDRMWRWLAALTLAGYASLVTLFVAITGIVPCLLYFGPGASASSGPRAFGPVCSVVSPLAQLLSVASLAAGPVAMLAFAIRGYEWRRALMWRAQPTPASDYEDELEVTVERM